MRHQAMLGDIVEEFALDVERPARELDLDLAVLADVLDAILEQVGDVGGIGGGGDRHDGLGIRNPPGGGEDRRTAEAVPDQDRGRAPCLAQMISGAHEIGHVRREGRVGEIAFAGSEPREVKPQHRNPLCGQRRRDALRRQHILAAGKTMGKQRIGTDRSIRRIQRGGKLMTAFTVELKPFMRHGHAPWVELALIA